MFDDIINKILSKKEQVPKEQCPKKQFFNNQNNSFINMKPKKQFVVAGKPVQVFNNNPIPSIKNIKNVYKKIPDDTRIPLQFMTRKQYLKTYIKNQEHAKNIDFSKREENAYLKQQSKEYNNIIGRYTTKNNPYYPLAVVMFNDKSNVKNIKDEKFQKTALHEFGHELVEKKRLKMSFEKEERFADSIADYGMRYNKKINVDDVSKDMMVYHGTTPMASMQIKTQGILTSKEIKDNGSPYFELSNKTNPSRTYFFDTKEKAAMWSKLATENSMFPQGIPKVIEVDIPDNELFPDLEMPIPGAFYKHGHVKPSQIKNIYDVKPEDLLQESTYEEEQIQNQQYKEDV